MARLGAFPLPLPFLHGLCARWPGLHLLSAEAPAELGRGDGAPDIYPPGSCSTETLQVGCVHLANVTALLAVLATPLSFSPGGMGPLLTLPLPCPPPQGTAPSLFFP